MSYGNNHQQIENLTKQMNEIRTKIVELRRAQAPQKVQDYEFTSASGEKTKLSALFGDKDELFVVHNMGRGCSYCTLWADGFNGVVHHLESRAAFVVSSPDAPEVQAAFAKSRDWKFRMVSTKGLSFAKDLGYESDKGVQPGVSVFVKKADGIFRVSDNEFGPGDDYASIWNLFDLLPTGVGSWSPKFAYRDGK